MFLKNFIRSLVRRQHIKWSKKRFELFKNELNLRNIKTLVDLGGKDGSYMKLFDSGRYNFRIIIADIDENVIKKASCDNFETILLKEGDRLPFKDKEIDCIFCNSVIEHVTVPKKDIWIIKKQKLFKDKSLQAQKLFADEIRRCAKTYFVQTPHKHFPIESHTWFPFTATFLRYNQIRLIKLLNKFWLKGTVPDWNLLTEPEMHKLFPDAEIITNRVLGFPKEIIAIKR